MSFFKQILILKIFVPLPISLPLESHASMETVSRRHRFSELEALRQFCKISPIHMGLYVSVSVSSGIYIAPSYDESIAKALLQSKMINFAIQERFEFRLKLGKRKRSVTNVLREHVP